MYSMLMVICVLFVVCKEVKGQQTPGDNDGQMCCPQLQEQLYEMEKRLRLQAEQDMLELKQQVIELREWKKKWEETNVLQTSSSPQTTTNNPSQETSVHFPAEGYKVYFIAFIKHRGNPGHNSLMISAKNSTSVHVYSRQPSYNKTYNIQNNGFVRITDITTNAEVALNATVTQQGILVNATEEVWVQGGSVQDSSIDGFNAIHIGPDSTEYIIIVERHSDYVGFVVVATQDETLVKIFKPVTGGGSVFAAQTTLNKLDTYAWYDIDVTGFRVISNKPVAVYAGDICSDSCDHMVSSIPPIARLGKDYVVPHAPKSNSYILKIVANNANTNVTVFRDSVSYSVVLHENQFYNWTIAPADEPLNVRCSSPCLVSQMNVGLTSSKKDPYMMITTPNSALSQNIRFGTLNPFPTNRYFQDIFLIIISINQTTTFELNGNPLQTTWYPISGGNGGSYLYSTIKIQKGFYHLKSTSTTGGFAAYVQGFNNTQNPYEGFGYRLGLF